MKLACIADKNSVNDTLVTTPNANKDITTAERAKAEVGMCQVTSRTRRDMSASPNARVRKQSVVR